MIIIRSIIQQTVSVASEVIKSHDRPETNLLRPSIKIIPDAVPVTHILPISGGMLSSIKTSRLFIQEEEIPVRRATGWRIGTDVIGNEGSAGIKSPGCSRFHARLDPV